MANNIVTLDVREDIRNGREPFSKIMGAVAALKPGQDLKLIAPFQPTPLLSILRQQGFTHTATETAEGDWEVTFSRDIAPASPAHSGSPSTTSSRCTGTPVVEVDTRGFEPPEPLVKILEALSALPEKAELRALTDRRPMHLYTQLAERGFLGASEQHPRGHFVTMIWRRTGA